MLELLGLLAPSIAQVWMYNSWAPVLLTCTLFLTYQAYKKFHWSVALCFLYTACLNVYLLVIANNLYGGFPTLDQIVLRSKGSYNFLVLLLFGSVYFCFKPANWLSLAKTLGVLCIVESLYILAQALWGVIPYQRAGFYNNASMAGCFIAATMPFITFLKLDKLYLFSLVLLCSFCIFLTNSSMSLGVLAVCAVAYGWTTRYKWYSLATAGFIVLGGYISQGKNLFDPSGRGSIIFMGWVYFKEFTKELIGTGPGTSTVFIPYLQSIHHPEFFKRNVFLWYHSDWFQILFEQGWLGLIVYSIAYIFALIKSYNYPPVFASVAAIGAWSMGNYPFHWPVHSLICVGIILMSFTLENIWQEKTQKILGL